MQRDGERTVAEHSQDVGEFVATLAELKHDGCSLLVVGDVGTAARCTQSRALLGSVDEPRHRILGITPDAGDPDAYLPSASEATPSSTEAGRAVDSETVAASETTASETTDSETADSETADSETTDSETHVVRANGVARSATDTAAAGSVGAMTTTPDGPSSPTTPAQSGAVSSDTDTMVQPAVFRARIVETIVRLTRSHDLSPSQLRVGVATLGPVIDAGGTDAAREFVSVVGDVTTDVAGMAHFHAPVSMDNDVVADLEPVVDACVELRQAADGGLLHRWHLSTLDGPSAWLELDG